MNPSRLQPEELPLVKKYFGKELKELDQEGFKEVLRAAKKKYHPDNFAKFEDDTVLEMAKERFQQLQQLGAKIEEYLSTKALVGEEPELEATEAEPGVVYVSEGIKVDIMTRDKTLKYQLFGRRIIYRGDSTNIPNTKAKIVALEDYSPRIQTGFRDNVKILLAFGESEDVRDIVGWLFSHISGRTSSFVIEGKVVKVDPYEILKAIQKESRLELGPGS
ncbi:MAG: hypothetical protein AAF399_28285 [Bacteroidota bacterium]